MLFFQPGGQITYKKQPMVLIDLVILHVLWQRFMEKDSHACFQCAVAPLQNVIGKVFAIGENEGMIGFRSYRKSPTSQASAQQCFSRQNLIIHLMLQKVPAHYFKPVTISHPFGAGRIKYPGAWYMDAIVYQMAHSIHICHQIGKIRKLGVVSPCVKVRRTIPVGKFLHGEGVGNKIIHSVHQHMIRQPFHQLQSFRPSIGAENFAHGSALF